MMQVLIADQKKKEPVYSILSLLLELIFIKSQHALYLSLWMVHRDMVPCVHVLIAVLEAINTRNMEARLSTQAPCSLQCLRVVYISIDERFISGGHGAVFVVLSSRAQVRTCAARPFSFVAYSRRLAFSPSKHTSSIFSRSI